MHGTMADLGERLKRLREAAGETQQGLAEKAGLAIGALRAIEQGIVADPKLTTLRKLAAALGCTIDDLAGPTG
ncbi:MAG: helix-turn-helix domain-containing protein [Gemmataceae bacterium]|nr:helix-turn-helix domain-containing protein [Gemmataceae bacterium]